MNIIPEILIKTLNLSVENATIWSLEINKTCEKFSITSKNCIAMFVAQCAHESKNFTRLVENLNYSAQGLANTWPKRYANADKTPNALAKAIERKPIVIANTTYANRLGNGSIESGDGWKFRGRGIIQLTGRDNYKQFSDTFNLDLLNRPELLETPEIACLSAGWYWKSRNLNKHAETGNILLVTQIINGGEIGLKERTELYEEIKKEL